MEEAERDGNFKWNLQDTPPAEGIVIISRGDECLLLYSHNLS
jgi:hypothetical protein